MCQVELNKENCSKKKFDIQDLQHTFSGGKYARIKAISSLENPVEFPNQDCIDPTLLVETWQSIMENS